MAEKTVLITGASRGIGAAILQGFAKYNTKPYVLATATSKQGVLDINKQLDDLGIKGRGLILDCSTPDLVQSFLDQLAADYTQGIDMLINNAGVTADQLLLRMSQEDWEKVLQCNLHAVFQLTKFCTRGMMKKRWGRIVNITSVSAALGNAGQANYAASKAAVEGFSRSVARELAGRSITCNCVSPGFVSTDMTKKLSEQQITSVLKQVPMGRMADVNEIAYAVHFFLAEQAAYMTGITLPVNGGLVMGGI